MYQRGKEKTPLIRQIDKELIETQRTEKERKIKERTRVEISKIKNGEKYQFGWIFSKTKRVH